MTAPTDILADLKIELQAAAEGMLTSVDVGLAALARARENEPDALEEIEAALCAIMQQCAFADLASQRLTQLEPHLGDSPEGHARDRLLAGPPKLGQALDQQAADALLAEA